MVSKYFFKIIAKQLFTTTLIIASVQHHIEMAHSLSSSSSPLKPPSTASVSSSPSPLPFRLKRLDHIVLRCNNYKKMFHFYTNILGCTIDDESSDVGRFDGVLTHLRAGDAYIDLLAYDVTSDVGKEALYKMHSGGKGISISPNGENREINFSSNTSTMDHLCLRIEPFQENLIRSFLEEHNVKVIGSGDRKGAEGVGPSIYVEDPEGNVIELKGPSPNPYHTPTSKC